MSCPWWEDSRRNREWHVVEKDSALGRKRVSLAGLNTTQNGVLMLEQGRIGSKIPQEVRDWLDENIGKINEDWDWSFSDRKTNTVVFRFPNKDDAFFFMLVWGGNI